MRRHRPENFVNFNVMEENYVHLHVHSDHSLYNAVGTPKEIIDTAISFGMPGIAITDYSSLLGINEGIEYLKSINSDFKLIIGAELYIEPDEGLVRGKMPYHIIILCKNEDGYDNLQKLLDIAYKNIYFRPKIKFEDLEINRDGLVIITGFIGSEIANLITQQKMKEAEDLIKKYSETFGSNFYLELDRTAKDLEGYKDIEHFLLEMNNKFSVPLLATNNTSFIKKEDKERFTKVLKSYFPPLSEDYSLPDSWLKNQREMHWLFQDIEQAYCNTLKLFHEIDKFYPSKWVHPDRNWNEKEHYKILNEIRSI